MRLAEHVQCIILLTKSFAVLPQVNVKAKSAFNNKLFALNVVISIPVPDNTAKADIQTTQGEHHMLLGCGSCLNVKSSGIITACRETAIVGRP